MSYRTTILATAAATVIAASPAAAVFHLMQIHQVIGGVDGDPAVQAVQLRMRGPGENFVSQARLYAHDAAGLNPVLLLDFPSDIVNTEAGTHILLATSNFSSHTTPAVTPDFVLTNPIPASYLPTGSLTFEDKFGTVYWRLSWGGGAYTGTGSGDLSNDSDGDFNPAFSGPLPSSSGAALLFQGTASAPSTTNAADYAVTSSPATFFYSLGESGTVQSLVAVGDGGLAGLIALSAPQPNPVQSTMAYSVTIPYEARVRVELFDVGGRRLHTLVDSRFPGGRHGFTWDAGSGEARRLPSGVYLLGLTVERAREMRRFVLLR